jgi:hypothetical protein
VASDTRFHDADQLAEIELYSALVIAASAHDGPLTTAEVDQALGLRPAC